VDRRDREGDRSSRCAPRFPSIVIAFREKLRACLGALEPPRNQNWLAEQSGIPPSTISRILKGDRNATPEVIESLAPVLGMDPAYLVKGTDAEDRYVKSNDLVNRSMYDAVVGTLAEYEARVNDLEGKLRVLGEARAKDHEELSRVHQALARAESDRDEVREENRRLTASNQDYRAGLSRAVKVIANLQADLKMLGDELATTKKSSRAAAILAGVAAFSGVVTLATYLNNNSEHSESDDDAEGEEE
jgi:transcriptional regulator with XRE-family HTH domain